MPLPRFAVEVRLEGNEERVEGGKSETIVLSPRVVRDPRPPRRRLRSLERKGE